MRLFETVQNSQKFILDVRCDISRYEIFSLVVLLILEDEIHERTAFLKRELKIVYLILKNRSEDLVRRDVNKSRKTHTDNCSPAQVYKCVCQYRCMFAE